jgi:metaxin
VPAPIKQLFDRFPLLSYPANELPLRAPRHRSEHVLYVFATEGGARRGEPSFNPSCLKWQVRDTIITKSKRPISKICNATVAGTLTPS